MSIKKNTIYNLLGSIIPMLIGIISIPFLVSKIGVELFGILSIIWLLVGYFGLFDFGIGRSLTQQIAFYRKSNNNYRISVSISSGIILSLFFGIVGAIILACLSNTLAFNWLGISVGIQKSVFWSILITSIAVPITTITSSLRGVLEGEMNFKIANILKVILGVFNFLAPVIVVAFISQRLEIIVISLVCVRIIVLGFHLFYLREHILSMKLSMVYKNLDFKLLRIGSWMTVSTIIGPLMVIGDRFLISNILGASMVAFYTIPFDAIIRLSFIPTSLSSALFPKLASVSCSYDKLALYGKGLRVVVIIMLPICLFLAIFSKQVLAFWLGISLANDTWQIMTILSFGVFFNSLAQIPFSGLHANESVRSTAIIHILEFVFYLPLILLGIHFSGIKGAAFVFSLRCFIDYITLHKVFYQSLKLN